MAGSFAGPRADSHPCRRSVGTFPDAILPQPRYSELGDLVGTNHGVSDSGSVSLLDRSDQPFVQKGAPQACDEKKSPVGGASICRLVKRAPESKKALIRATVSIQTDGFAVLGGPAKA